MAAYVRRAGDPAWSALAMDVLRIEEGAIAEILTFGPDVALAVRVQRVVRRHAPSPSQRARR